MKKENSVNKTEKSFLLGLKLIGYNFLVRDIFLHRLYAYQRKPIKGNGVWMYDSELSKPPILVDKDLFNFIKIEDGPFEIKGDSIKNIKLERLENK